jgi:hypothetical protein
MAHEGQYYIFYRYNPDEIYNRESMGMTKLPVAAARQLIKDLEAKGEKLAVYRTLTSMHLFHCTDPVLLFPDRDLITCWADVAEEDCRAAMVRLDKAYGNT